MNIVRQFCVLACASVLGLGPVALSAQDDTSAHLAPPVERAELLSQLQQGGLVMLIRHERTEYPSRQDDYTRPSDECRAQRNLSLAGVAGSQETGIIMRALGIKVGRVISSPMCRSTETARYMFGVDFETDDRLMHHDPSPRGHRSLDQAEQDLRDVLAELAPVQPETNIAIVSHGGNIVRVTGLSVSEGEIAVLRLTGDGGIEALGQFMGSDLAPYARHKHMEETAAKKLSGI